MIPDQYFYRPENIGVAMWFGALSSGILEMGDSDNGSSCWNGASRDCI